MSNNLLGKLFAMSADTGRGRSVDRRADVLFLLRCAGTAMTCNEIAELLRVHPNTVRFHLAKLVQTGRVEQVPADHHRPGRPPRQFRLVPGMDPAGPRHYRALAEVLLREVAAGPEPESRAEAAGRAWGAALAGAGRDDLSAEQYDDVSVEDAVGVVVALLTELGFAPEPPQTAEPVTIALTHCPFLELVPVGPGLVCHIHLGLMRGALEAMSSANTVKDLRPFVTPDRCVARLAGAA